MNTTTKKAKPPKIAKKKLLSWYRQMVTIRQFEEKVRELYEKSVMPGITHLSIGQEAVAVGVCGALQPADYITSTHRGHGHCLAKGADLGRMFAELMGKVDGYCRGKGGSMHIANQEAGHLGANAIIGGGMALATGAALSAKLRKSNQIAVCFFGDGALNQGIFFEAMNMAAIWQLPIIYACENNQYGEYTPMQRVTAGDVQARGQAFDIPSVGADGMDVIIAHEASVKAVKHVRDGKGPSFLIFDTYRYSGHGVSDQTRPYRSREEEREWREQRDPVDPAGQTINRVGTCCTERSGGDPGASSGAGRGGSGVCPKVAVSGPPGGHQACLLRLTVEKSPSPRPSMRRCVKRWRGMKESS